jgi:hypothetical protein
MGILRFESAGCRAGPSAAATAIPPAADRRVIFIGKNLSDEEIVCFMSAVAGSRRHGIALLDSPDSSADITSFLTAYQPDSVIQVGHSLGRGDESVRKLGRQAKLVKWDSPFPERFWRSLHLTRQYLVVCRAPSRRLLLQAACLAGVLHAPMCIVHHESEKETLKKALRSWGTRKVFAIGGTCEDWIDLPQGRLSLLPDEQSVVAKYIRRQRKFAPVTTLVVANPADTRGKNVALSSLGPWLALEKHAILGLTNGAGSNVREVEKGTQLFSVRGESVIFLADFQAIPLEHRPNPAPGKDTVIDVEPLSPPGNEPFTYATGRLFHRVPASVPLLLAREQFLARESSRPGEQGRKALVISNPAGGLPLLETFSRNTASELRNAGYDTTAIFGGDVTPHEVRRLLPQQDIFLWEGHHSTMTREYGLPGWSERLRPSLLFLQSCLALCEEDALPLLSRGAVAVIGTPNRTYSGSGGACSLAFFDALLYEDQSIGASLRHAKNFLAACALLKEKRLGDDARLCGADVRSAWAFSLWGDPTLKMPRADSHVQGLLSVQHEVRGNVIELRRPEESHEPVVSERYRAQMFPNARLAGLVRKKGDSSQRELAPLIFAEVHLPNAPKGKVPRLHSRMPADHWVFNWDPRRKCGYLLVTPRAKDTGDLEFRVRWE